MDFPVPQPDYSYLAWVSMWVVVASLLATIVIKSIELIENHIAFRQKLDHENEVF